MGSFPIAVTSPQLATLRTSGYWARVLVAANDNAVVFMAQSTQSISIPFMQFNFDNVTVGAYTSAWEGMVLYLSHTTDPRDAYFRGRVRSAPTSSIMYVDRNASLLLDNDYVIICRDSDLFSRERLDTLVDGVIPYHATPDVLTGLPSAIVLYDSDADGDVSYTTVQTPVRVASGSTSTTTWAWSVSGAGISSISNAAIQNPTITFQAGYHYLLRVVHTNNLGQINYQIAHVYAITRTFAAPCLQSIATGSVSADLENGWTANLTAYAQVDTLLDRTHCAVFTVQHFGDGSSTPIVSNILMNGRIRSDSIQTEGSIEAGRVQSVTFVVEGITAYLRRETIPNDIIRATSTPDEWGEIIEPNPWRMAIYAAWVYTTLTNICSIGAESGLFAAWEIGGEPRGIDGGYVYDVLASILDPIKAAVNFAPDGSLFLARTVSYLTDRSGVVTIATFTLGDLIEYSVDRDSSKTTSQVVAYGGSFNSFTNTFDVYSAQSPSIIYLEGQTRELTREILEADATIDDAATELKDRASNHYGYENPKPLLQGQLFDSWAGVLVPTNYQRWGATLPASSNTLGVAYGASDFWQLQSVSLAINPDGAISTSFDAPAETSFDDAQSLGALLPNNLSNMAPVNPMLPNDPAFPTDPLENYPTDTPGLEELQPIDPFSGMQAYTPFPPDVAAQIALNTGTPNCRTLAVNFRNSTNAESTWTTVLNDDYLITADGFAQTNLPVGVCTNLKATQGDFVGNPNSGYATWFPGEGLGPGPLFLGVYPFAWVLPVVAQVGLVVRMVFTLNQPTTRFTVYRNASNIYDSGTTPATVFDIDATTPITGTLFPWNTATGAVRFSRFDNSADENLRVTRICMYTASSGDPAYADTFYEFELDEDGNPINVSLLTDGLYIDNTEYTPVPTAPFPPFQENHRYTGLPFTGTGNSFLARMEMASYTGNQNVYLNITVCKKRAAP